MAVLDLPSVAHLDHVVHGVLLEDVCEGGAQPASNVCAGASQRPESRADQGPRANSEFNATLIRNEHLLQGRLRLQGQQFASVK